MAIWCKSTEDHWGLPSLSHTCHTGPYYIHQPPSWENMLQTLSMIPCAQNSCEDHVIAWHSNQLSQPARSTICPTEVEIIALMQLQRSTTSAALKYLAELNLQIWRLGKRNWGKFSSLFQQLGQHFVPRKVLAQQLFNWIAKGRLSPMSPWCRLRHLNAWWKQWFPDS